MARIWGRRAPKAVPLPTPDGALDARVQKVLVACRASDDRPKPEAHSTDRPGRCEYAPLEVAGALGDCGRSNRTLSGVGINDVGAWVRAPLGRGRCPPGRWLLLGLRRALPGAGLIEVEAWVRTEG